MNLMKEKKEHMIWELFMKKRKKKLMLVEVVSMNLHLREHWELMDYH